MKNNWKREILVASLPANHKDMVKSKYIAKVDIDRCVACGVCMNTCPRDAAKVYKGCYSVIDMERCVGCGLCVEACPAAIITRVERSKEEDAA